MKIQFLLIYVIIVLLQTVTDPYLMKCKNRKGQLLIISHHFLQWYFFIGSFTFGYHKFHLLTVILAFIIHKSFGMCPITIIHNQLCNFNNKKYLFTLINRFIQSFNIQQFTAVQMYYFMLFCVFMYDILHIYKHK